MRVGVIFVQLQRFSGCGLYCLIRLKWFNVGVCQPEPRLGYSHPRAGERWILVQGTLEYVETFPQVFFITLIREIKTLQIKVVGLGVLWRPCRWRNRELDLQRVNNRTRDLILNGEHALQFALKRI